MTGVYVVAVAVLLALGFGLYRKAVDGRVRAAPGTDGLDAGRLGEDLGTAATFLQFSAPVCAPCRATRRVLGDLTADSPGVAHIEIDAQQRPDLVDELGITRTPTVLLLDGGGRVRGRIVGAPTRPDALRALDSLLDGRRS
jgi:thiol-disulfide isomerase/thioredoxin